VYSKARSNIEKSQQMQKKYYDKAHKVVRFQVGQLVLLRTHCLSDKARKITKKFAYRWNGPFRIARIVTPVSYELVTLDGNTNIGTQNVQHLKHYYDRPSYEDAFHFSDKQISSRNDSLSS